MSPTIIGYFMAVVVRANRRGSTLLRTIFFLPYVIGLTTLSFLMVLEAQPDSGAVNLILKSLHITDGSTAWLVNGPLATGLICVLIIWAVSGPRPRSSSSSWWQLSALCSSGFCGPQTDRPRAASSRRRKRE